MIGQTISHYPATKWRDAKKRHKILEEPPTAWGKSAKVDLSPEARCSNL
jgi:hypothetical protein